MQAATPVAYISVARSDASWVVKQKDLLCACQFVCRIMFDTEVPGRVCLQKAAGSCRHPAQLKTCHSLHTALKICLFDVAH